MVPRQGILGGGIPWKRGNFATDRDYDREDGFLSFDSETAVADKQLADAILARGVSSDRLIPALLPH
jgi:hypothetical protein